MRLSGPARALAALALLGTIGCAPGGAGPVDVVVLVFNPARQAYEPTRVTLKTPTDIVALEGPIINLKGGAKFVVDESDPALQAAGEDVAAIRRAITKNEGSSVKVDYISGDDGVLVPADFDSLNLVTTYYNFERSFDFFKKVGGLDSANFPAPDVHYFPELKLYGETVKDNAMFMALIQGFMILPFDQFKLVPMAINGGVMGHEFSHAIFNYRIFNREPLPDVLIQWEAMEGLPAPGANLLNSLNEGSADVFGTGITCTVDLETCSPNFMALTVPKELSEDRRLDVPHCMTEALQMALEQTPANTFTDGGVQYMVGSVFASAMWRASSDTALVTRSSPGKAREQMFAALYKAEGGDGGTGIKDLVSAAAADQSMFSFQSGPGSTKGVADVIIDAATDPDLKRALCQAFLDRFGLTASAIRSCPANAQPYGDCK